MYKVWPENAVSSELLFLNSEPEGNEICYFLLKENVNIQQNLSIIWAPFGGESFPVAVSTIPVGATPGGISGKLSFFLTLRGDLYSLSLFLAFKMYFVRLSL